MVCITKKQARLSVSVLASTNSVVTDSVLRLWLRWFQSRTRSRYWDSEKSSLGLGINIETQKNPVLVSKLRIRKLQSRNQSQNRDSKNTSLGLSLKSLNSVSLITDLTLDNCSHFEFSFKYFGCCYICPRGSCPRIPWSKGTNVQGTVVQGDFGSSRLLSTETFTSDKLAQIIFYILYWMLWYWLIIKWQKK